MEASTQVPARMPTFYIPHGGGPCFFMDPGPGQPAGLWDGMARYLKSIAADVGSRPKAIVVVSAHWETAVPTVLAAPAHDLLFDYYGFPEHTYRLTYPVDGSPEVASRIRGLLAGAGIETAEELERGLDHGVFVPFKLIYPDADVPIVQLSLHAGLSPERHLEIGRALAPLRDEGVLIVGSGMSFHNMRDMFSERAVAAGDAFDEWLAGAVESHDFQERARLLGKWAEAPGGRYSHPREEHLLPLMVAAGAAGEDSGRRTYSERLGGRMAISGFRFG
jgi:aromatic ring-opening dioxygenase catalytic subunit (LigB family)